MPPCRSSPLFALRPNAVAQTRMRMVPCRWVHRLHHVVFQGMDGLELLQLPLLKQADMEIYSTCNAANMNVQNKPVETKWMRG